VRPDAVERLFLAARPTKAPALAVSTIRGDVQRLVVRSPQDGELLPPGLLFNIGSVAKTFTGAALADLASRGEVDLDAPIVDVLPAWDWLPPKVTFRALATHTAGLRREADGGRPPTSAAELREAVEAGRRRTPGRYHYSNLGYMLLGHALAAVAGKPLPELISSRLLEPSGLQGIRFGHDLDDVVCATGVRADTGEASAETHDALPGASNIYASGPTLARWASTWLDPPAALADTVRIALANPFPLGAVTAVPESWSSPALPGRRAVGLAWRIEQNGLVWHAGGTNGFTTMCAFDRATRSVTVALLAAGVGNLPSSPTAAPSLMRLLRLRRKLRRLSLHGTR
jgi:CubicO group peptidase (beta-lactamase class C family)